MSVRNQLKLIRTSHPSGSGLLKNPLLIGGYRLKGFSEDPLAVITAPENRRFHAVSNGMYHKSYGC